MVKCVTAFLGSKKAEVTAGTQQTCDNQTMDGIVKKS